MERPIVAMAVLVVLVASNARTAVVLPRPPSSPNFIPHDYEPRLVGLNSKSYGSEKAAYQNTNVEKPDTQDYRFLEIELRDADSADSLELHGLVQAVLSNHQQQLQTRSSIRRFDDDEAEEFEGNATYPRPEVVPHSILGVRDVGLGPSQRLIEDVAGRQHYVLAQSGKNPTDEKLYYLKSARPKVYVNFRASSGNFRNDAADSRMTLRLEPSAFLRATQPYHMEKKTKSPKKYESRIHGETANEPTSSTTENAMVTSSELPKQIPAPPSRVPTRSAFAHTTPVQRYTARRTDILPEA